MPLDEKDINGGSPENRAQSSGREEKSEQKNAADLCGDASEEAVAFWADEDPQALPDVVIQATAKTAPLDNIEESAPSGETTERPLNDQCASVSHSPADPAEKAAEEKSVLSVPQDAARSKGIIPGPDAEQADYEEDNTDEKDNPRPTFPKPAPHVLPPCEETQEVPGGPQRRRRSFFAQLLNTLWWFVIIALFGTIIFAGLYYRYASDRLFNIQFDTNRTVVLTVAPGERLSHIIEKLRAEGLLSSYLGVDDGFLLKYLAWINNNSNKIKSGVYRLNSSMSLSQIYDKLIEGSQDFKVTIPEGKTAKETAALIKRKLDSFDENRFLALVHDPQFIEKLGLSVPSLEGYLYPDTYFFAPGMKEEEIIRMMVENFIKRAETALSHVERTETSDTLSFHEHVIMASLIEREARLDTERPLIASVIFNRLKKGMKLEIDAAINYALGDWGKRLTHSDLQTSSPYNTYLHKGLPPGPICNPHISSLVATFQPAKTNYLFYVYKGDGSHAFAETYEEHLANIRLYRRGASSPKPSVEGSLVRPDQQPEKLAEASESGAYLAQQTGPPSSNVAQREEEQVTTESVQSSGDEKSGKGQPPTRQSRKKQGKR